MTSLIQQRMALDRLRAKALWAIWGGGIGAAIGLVLMLTSAPRPWPPWLGGAVWVVFLVYGLIWMRQYRRAVRDFEAEHGAGAGEQH